MNRLDLAPAERQSCKQTTQANTEKSLSKRNSLKHALVLASFTCIVNVLLLALVHSVNRLDIAIGGRSISYKEDLVVNLALLHLLERRHRCFRRSDGRNAMINLKH